MATIKDRYILEVDTEKGISGMNAAGVAAGGLGGKLKGIGPLAVAAGAAIAGMGAVRGISNTITEMDDLAKAARNVGAATDEEFEGFQTASKLLGEMGITAGETDRAFRNMTTRLEKAAETGKGPAAAAFEKLGNSVLKANGDVKDFPELFEAVSTALAEGKLTVVEAQGALGEMVGPKILGGMQQLAESGVSVKDALSDVAANSNIVSLDAAENAEKFGDTMGRLQEVAGRLGTEVVEKLLPHLVNLAENALAVLPGFIDGVIQSFETLQPVFDLIGTILSEVVIPAMKLLFEALGEVAKVVGPLAEAAIPALKSGFESLGNIVSSIIDFFVRAGETLQNIYDKAIQLKDATTGAFKSVKDGAVGAAKDTYEGVTGWFGDMYDEVVGNSIVPDMADGVLESFKGMSSGMVSRIAEAVPAILDSMSNIAGKIGERFEGITGISLTNIKSQVSTLSGELGSRISELSNSVSSRFNSIKSSVGTFAGDIGVTDLFKDFSSNFAGFFANGGMIPAGQFGVVGERGPELISGPGQITPFSQLGGAQPVTYNINAVDAQSFKQLLARDPQFIHAVAMKGAERTPFRRL